MDSRQYYDVVILGAGIAGLLLASELAQHHKVLVLEKGAGRSPSKYWLTDKGCAEANGEMSEAIDSIYSSIDFVAHDETRYRCFGKYVLWDTKRLVAVLVAKIEKAGGTILPNSTFYSYRNEKTHLRLFVNDFQISTQLAVDCMGYASPIIYAANVVEVLGYYLMYGATFKAKREVDPVGLHNIALSDKPGYVEAFPTSNGMVHLALIMPAGKIRDTNSLKRDFDFLVNRSPYRHVIEHSTDEREFLGGIIPAGRLRRHALDRIYFFGEAGQVNPAATATCLTRMLYTYKETAAFLTASLGASTTTSRELGRCPVQHVTPFDRRLHIALFLKILCWNSDKFAAVVREMIRNNDHDLVNQVMFGQLDTSPRLAMDRIFRLAKNRSSHILRAIAGGFTGR